MQQQLFPFLPESFPLELTIMTCISLLYSIPPLLHALACFEAPHAEIFITVAPYISSDFNPIAIPLYFLKSLSTGYLNTMTVYFNADDVEKKQALVVRVFKEGLFPTEVRELEFIKMQVL